MKVIDLLNKIANGEDVPKEIKYNDYILTYDEDTQDYYNEPRCSYALLEDIHNKLNDEVEIIEDTPKEDKKIEKLNKRYAFQVSKDVVQGWTKNELIILDKLDEIIDGLDNK